MAKIEETIYIVKLSRLVKDKGDKTEVTGLDHLPETIEQVVQGLVSNDTIVEVEQA